MKNNPIKTCLWFDGQAKTAAELYCSIFRNSKIIAENPIVLQFEKILHYNSTLYRSRLPTFL
jgi:predicted 3-demethylubiquinone-9 3-methyltransferase (glyoxalase superfamily)